jgi:hypothetical protein
MKDKPMKDKVRIRILPGGLIKIETDRISAPNHLSAERLIRGLEEDLGGETEVERKKERPLAEHQKQQQRDFA